MPILWNIQLHVFSARRHATCHMSILRTGQTAVSNSRVKSPICSSGYLADINDKTNKRDLSVSQYCQLKKDDVI